MDSIKDKLTETTEKAFAKLNLTLDVTGGRDDGYHELTMVMISVSLWDELTVSLRIDGETRCTSTLPWLPTDDRNHAIKAAKAFFSARGGEYPGLELFIRKRVPVGAGMAGGSTDAAAVLRALNRLTGAPFSASELREIGLTVGSDVPYCVSGGVMLAKGRGELLTPLPMLPDCFILVCKPRFSVSTAELYSRVDSRAADTHPDTAGMLEALRTGSLSGVAARMFNVFEDVLPEKCREILSIRSALLDAGALGAIMTGTGSAVFGLFAEEKTARAAKQRLLRHYSECFLCKALPGIPL